MVSRGISMWTGPGLPLRATLKAFAMTAGISSILSTLTLHLVTFRYMSSTKSRSSTPWKASRLASRGTAPEM